MKKNCYKLLMILLIVFVVSIFFIYLIDRRLNKTMGPYIDVEVERLTNNIVNAKVNEIISNVNLENYFSLNNVNNNIKISYDTVGLNKLKSMITKEIENELTNLDNGVIDDYFVPSRIKKGKFKNVKKGILCDVSIGSIRGSSLFSNVGPTIPIKLLFSSQLNSDIDVNIKEYGINNAIVEVYFVIYIKEQINMPLTSKRKKIEIREPLLIDIISGKIPDYYGGYIK